MKDQNTHITQIIVLHLEANLPASDVHELLCKAIHECDRHALGLLTRSVTDITLVEEPKA
jgi:hypothetical protein